MGETTKSVIFRDIETSPPHSIFFISDYSHIGSPETIRKIFFEATISGELKKAAKGIFFKPKTSVFGEVPIPLEKIAIRIAERDKCRILPTGATAANMIGLSTQVPMTISYISSGTTRTISIGDRQIHFRHASPKNFAGQGSVAPLLTQGLREIGLKNLTPTHFDAISKFIESRQDPFFEKDLFLAPAWIQKIVRKITQK